MSCCHDSVKLYNATNRLVAHSKLCTLINLLKKLEESMSENFYNDGSCRLMLSINTLLCIMAKPVSQGGCGNIFRINGNNSPVNKTIWVGNNGPLASIEIRCYAFDASCALQNYNTLIADCTEAGLGLPDLNNCSPAFPEIDDGHREKVCCYIEHFTLLSNRLKLTLTGC